MTPDTPRPRIIHLVAAARPNFMKVAPLFHALSHRPDFEPRLIHCGQHYDANMSDVFWRALRLPAPHRALGVGSGSHAEQTGRAMIAYEQVLAEAPPDLTVVVGDVNSTLACALAAAKVGVPVAHLEAGLRAFDRTMPEEINRVLTDRLADLLWTPSPDADANLRREGIAADRIERVGNIMMDSLEMIRPAAEAPGLRQALGLAWRGYALVTLHRPSNVDTPAVLAGIVRQLVDLSRTLPLVFPVHPRTRDRLLRARLWPRLDAAPGITLLEPQGYVAFLHLLLGCGLVLTDSGGVQEETTYLGIPCLTLRPNTERPVTISHGTNRLCRPEDLGREATRALTAREPFPGPPPLWDGHTAERIVDSLGRHFARRPTAERPPKTKDLVF